MRPAPIKSAAHLRLVPPEMVSIEGCCVEPVKPKLSWRTKVARALNWRGMLMRFRVWRKCRQAIPF